MKTFAVFWLLACTAAAGEIYDLYRAELNKDTNSFRRVVPTYNPILRLTNAVGQSELVPGRVSTNHAVGEFGIERTQCYGTCPDYTFIVSANGRCRYEGRKYAKLQGKKTGQLPLADFHRVAEMLSELKFSELENQYEPWVTDSATTFTTAVISGQRKIVRNYAEGGPTRLWAIEELMDAMITHVRWDSEK